MAAGVGVHTFPAHAILVVVMGTVLGIAGHAEFAVIEIFAAQFAVVAAV